MLRTRRSAVMAIAITLLLAMPAAATGGRPDSGHRDIQSWALAYLSDAESLDCGTASLAVSFVAGDNLQSPIGSGKPGSWSDVELRLEIDGGCSEDGSSLFFFGSTNVPPDIELYRTARLDDVSLTLDAGSAGAIDATLDLTWIGSGEPTVRTENGDGYVRAERAVPAELTGSIEFGPYVLWGAGLTFTADNVDEASLGWAAEIDTLAPPRCVQRAAGLTGWWTGEGVADRVGGNDAVLRGDAGFGPGLVRSAFVLDGDGDYVEVADDPGIDIGGGDFTISLWLRFDDTSGEQVLVEKWLQGWDESSLGWTLTKLDNDSIRLAVSAPGRDEVVTDTEPGAIEPGIWYHVAARRSGTETTVFIDGVPRATGELDAAYDLSSTQLLTFGHRVDERGFFLDGRIDEVQLFVGTAVADGDIWLAYWAGAAGTCRNG